MTEDRHTHTPADAATFETNRAAAYDGDMRVTRAEIRREMAGLDDGTGEDGPLTRALRAAFQTVANIIYDAAAGGR